MKKNTPDLQEVRGHKVELPRIELGSYATSPGLLRAQFAQYLYSTLQIRQTCLDDRPSCR